MPTILDVTGIGRVGGQHAGIIEVKGVVFYFSYSTIIGIAAGGERWYSKNYWGVTTGRHLRQFQRSYPGITLDNAQFNTQVQAMCDSAGITAPSASF